MHMRDHVTNTHNLRHNRRASGLTFAETIAREQLDLLSAVNDERAALGKPSVTLAVVRSTDESCSGHVDYARKLGLRLQEMVRQ